LGLWNKARLRMILMGVNESRVRVIPWILVGIFGTLWLTKSAPTRPTANVTDSLPTLVQSVRDLGFLQSKEMNLQETFDFQTSRRPADWAAAIPGADNVVSAATKNEVSLTATGQVRAGFDLRNAKLSLEGDTVRVVLPRVTIQDPHVDVKLHNAKGGLFWKDSEIAVKAIHSARERFSSVAAKLKIERQAFESAERRIKSLLGKVTPKRIIIEQS
jgi:hypothetical protein